MTRLVWDSAQPAGVIRFRPVPQQKQNFYSHPSGSILLSLATSNYSMQELPIALPDAYEVGASLVSLVSLARRMLL